MKRFFVCADNMIQIRKDKREEAMLKKRRCARRRTRRKANALEDAHATRAWVIDDDARTNDGV